MALPTSSFRAPAEHHALVHAVAKALTRRPDLAEPLRVLLASVADTGAGAEALPSWADVLHRLAEVERQVAEHGALLATRGALQGGAGALPGMPALQASGTGAPENTGAIQASGTGAVQAETGALQALPNALQPKAEPWTVGEGRTKRLTPAAAAELDRRLQAGDPVAVIAEALGVSQQTVSKRRAAGGAA